MKGIATSDAGEHLPNRTKIELEINVLAETCLTMTIMPIPAFLEPGEDPVMRVDRLPVGMLTEISVLTRRIRQSPRGAGREKVDFSFYQAIIEMGQIKDVFSSKYISAYAYN